MCCRRCWDWDNRKCCQAEALKALLQVPQGATPRSMVVHLLGALTRTVKPGDAVTLSGVFLPEPFTVRLG